MFDVQCIDLIPEITVVPASPKNEPVSLCVRQGPIPIGNHRAASFHPLNLCHVGTHRI